MTNGPFTLSQHLTNYLNPISHLGLWLTLIIAVIILYIFVYKTLEWISYKIWPVIEEPKIEQEQDKSEVTLH